MVLVKLVLIFLLFFLVIIIKIIIIKVIFIVMPGFTIKIIIAIHCSKYQQPTIHVN